MNIPLYRLLSAVVFLFAFSFAQTKAKTCRGVYFVQFPVSEIEGMYNGILIDEDKGTCSRPIDIEKSDGLVLVEDSASVNRAVSGILSGKSLEDVNLLNLITPKRIIFSDTADLPVDLIRKNQGIINRMVSFSPYYLSDDGKYLYKFVQLVVDINELDLSNKNFQIESAVSQEDMGYYISDVLDCNPYICYSSSNIWIPFKDYFEQSKENVDFKALYVLKFSFLRSTESSADGKLIEVSSLNDAGDVVEKILRGDLPESEDGERFVFPFIPSQYEKMRLPNFYNLGRTEDIGVNFFRALNTETIIKENLNLAPYMISDDGRYLYKIIYIEGSITEYNQKKKRNYCYFVNLPDYSDSEKIEKVSGLTFSTPYIPVNPKNIFVGETMEGNEQNN